MSNNRVTNSDLEHLVARLNKITGHAEEPYTNGKPNNGTYIISAAYGGYKLEQMEGSGVRTISTDGYGTKKQLYAFLTAYIAGIELKRDR